MKKLTFICVAFAALAVFAKASFKPVAFSMVNKGRPCMGLKVVGFDPALTHAGREFTKIIRAVTDDTGYKGNGYYQLILGIAGNESSADAEEAVKQYKLSHEQLGDKHNKIKNLFHSSESSLAASDAPDAVFFLFENPPIASVPPTPSAAPAPPARKMKPVPIIEPTT